MTLFGGIKLWPIFVGRDLPLLFIREEFWQRSRTLLLRRQPLRLVDVASAPAGLEGEAGSLPEFLSDDEEREAAADEDRPQQLDAAE